MVDVTVREQHGGGLELVRREDLLDSRLGVLPGVDDGALFARRWRHDIAVSSE
jgi:hypothetical protein